MRLELSSLRSALASLDSALDSTSAERLAGMDEKSARTMKAGVIQNFEFTYELCWKLMRRAMSDEMNPAELEGLHRRELFRHAAERQLIESPEPWFRYHDDRNATSHSYDVATADRIFASATGFARDARSLLESLERRND